MDFEFGNGAEALFGLALALTTDGVATSAPRGLATNELLDVNVTIQDPTDVLLYGANRLGYHPAIGAIEGLLLLAGVSDPPLLQRAAMVFARFQDGGALHGAYGPRLRTQLPWVAERLANDPSTRQAVCTIWDPLYDLYGTTPRDLPCTVSLTFRIRDGKLTLKTHMRSNDLWRGWCYDVIQFTLLQASMANVLGVPMGAYVHHADSLHLYEPDVGVAMQVKYPPVRDSTTMLFGLSPAPTLASAVTERWDSVRVRALHVLYEDMFEPVTTTERWLREQVQKVNRKE